MTANSNIYLSLLVYSLLTGMLLRGVYDALTVLKRAFLYPPRRIKDTASHQCAPHGITAEKQKKTPISPILLQNTLTVKKAIALLRPLPKKSVIISTAIFDILFSILCALSVTLVLFGLNFGEIRWFVIPLTAAGYFAYGSTVGRPIKAILTFIVNSVSRALYTAYRLVRLPFVKLAAPILIKLSGKAKRFFKRNLRSPRVPNAQRKKRKERRKRKNKERNNEN